MEERRIEIEGFKNNNYYNRIFSWCVVLAVRFFGQLVNFSVYKNDNQPLKPLTEPTKLGLVSFCLLGRFSSLICSQVIVFLLLFPFSLAWLSL